MLVGIAVQQYDFDRTPTIIAAQAVTVVAAPLVAGVLALAHQFASRDGPTRQSPLDDRRRTLGVPVATCHGRQNCPRGSA